MEYKKVDSTSGDWIPIAALSFNEREVADLHITVLGVCDRGLGRYQEDLRFTVYSDGETLEIDTTPVVTPPKCYKCMDMGWDADVEAKDQSIIVKAKGTEGILMHWKAFVEKQSLKF